MSTASDGSHRFARLNDAIEVFLAHQAHGGDREAFLREHEDLRELLEPMLAQPTPEPDAARGDRYLGDYRLVREVGRGGMGVVYEAVHLPLRRRVALKVLSAHLTLAPRHIARFRREATAVANLGHPSIVPIYDVGEHDGAHFFAMEFVDGRSLAQALREPSRPLGVLADASHAAEVVEIVVRVADALHFAHENGVLHRDVKPDNILIGDDGAVRLVDFGLARDASATDLSQTGEFAGTPYYASPEQAAGEKRSLDERSDVFSLGVVLYEALARVRPFGGDSTQQILDAIRTRAPQPLRRLNAGVPHDLAVICHKALEKEPRDRYASAAEMAADLQRFARLEPIVAQPPGWLSRLGKAVRRNRLRAAIALLAAAFATGIPVLLWLHRVHIEQLDSEQLSRTRRILSEALEMLRVAKLEHQPGSERLHLELLQRVTAMYDELLRGGGLDSDRELDARVVLDSAAVLWRLSVAYRTLGEMREAMAICDRTVATMTRLVAAHPGVTHFGFSLATALRGRSSVLRAVSRLDECRRDLDRAITVLTEVERRAARAEVRDAIIAGLAKAHTARGDLLRAQPGGASAAAAESSESLQWWAKITAASAADADHAQALARARLSRGEVLLRTGRHDIARPDIEGALTEFERLLATNPNHPAFRLWTANAQGNLAYLLQADGEPDRAVQMYRDALNSHEGLANEFRETAAYLHNAANARLNLARALRRSGKVPEAAETIAAGLTDADRLCTMAPDQYSHHRVRAMLGCERAIVTSMLRETSVDDGVDVCRAACARLDELAKRRPFTEWDHYHLASVVYRLAVWLMRAGDISAARASADRAVGSARTALASSPTNPEHTRALQHYEKYLAAILERLGDHASAATLARTRLERTPTSKPALLQTAGALAICMALAKEDVQLAPDTAQTIADRYAREAVEAIEQALQLGAATESLVSVDGFEALQRIPAVRTLLDRDK